MITDPKVGMVENGAECGTQRVCVDGVCSMLSSIPPMRCPTNNVALQCSGHGVSVRRDIEPIFHQMSSIIFIYA